MALNNSRSQTSDSEARGFSSLPGIKRLYGRENWATWKFTVKNLPRTRRPMGGCETREEGRRNFQGRRPCEKPESQSEDNSFTRSVKLRPCGRTLEAVHRCRNTSIKSFQRLTSWTRYLFALAARYGLQIQQMDAVTAFLQGNLEEETYMEQPPNFEDPQNRAMDCRFNKALFGLEQSSRVWNNRLDSMLKKFGFTPAKYNPCVYFHIDGRGWFLW